MDSELQLCSVTQSVVFFRFFKAAEEDTVTFSGDWTRHADTHVVPSAPTAPVSVSTYTPELAVMTTSVFSLCS